MALHIIERKKCEWQNGPTVIGIGTFQTSEGPSFVFHLLQHVGLQCDLWPWKPLGQYKSRRQTY